MVGKPPYVPERGDVIWLNFDPQLGHEQAGRRPALVMSNRDYNLQIGLAVVFPITNQVKGYPFEVPIPAGLAVQGVVLTDHVKSVDCQARNAAFMGRVPVGVLTATLASLLRLLTK